MVRRRLLEVLTLASLCAAPGVAAAQPKPAIATEQPDPAPVLIYDGRIVLSVLDSQATAVAIGELARSLGGRYVSASERQVVVEVPHRVQGELVSRLRKLGEVKHQSVATEDASIAVADARAAARAARGARQRMQEARQKAQNVNEGLMGEREIEAAEKALAAAEARLAELQRRSEVVRFVITLRAPGRETVPTPVLPFPWLGGLGLSSLYEPSLSESAEEPSLELRAFVDGAMYVETAYAPDAEPLDDNAWSVAGGMSLRVLGEANPIGLFGGFDLVLGGGGGFLYEVQSLFGVGVPFGSRVALGLASGPGIDGMTGGVIDFGVSFPIELYLSLDLATWLGVTLWARDGWVVASEERKHGSDTSLIGDEASAGITLAFAPLAERESMGPYSDERLGLELGFGMRELLGTRIYELRLGWGGWDADFSTSH